MDVLQEALALMMSEVYGYNDEKDDNDDSQ